MTYRFWNTTADFFRGVGVMLFCLLVWALLMNATGGTHIKADAAPGDFLIGVIILMLCFIVGWRIGRQEGKIPEKANYEDSGHDYAAPWRKQQATSRFIGNVCGLMAVIALPFVLYLLYRLCPGFATWKIAG